MKLDKIKNVTEELQLSGHEVNYMKKINGANLIIHAVRK